MRTGFAFQPIPLIDYYSTTETGPIAWACPAGAFHALAPDVWLESIGGELAVTRLRPSALPILRYRTGDRGEVAAGTCACGRPGQRIVGFAGREACRFTTPSGATVDAWQLAFLFKHHPLDAFRLVQTGPTSFRLELDRDLPALRAQLAAALAQLGFPSPSIRLAPLVRAAAKHRPFSVEP